MELFDFFQYSFVLRALVAGSLISIGCSILGVLLVLRRFSLIGDGLAHVTFGAVAAGLLLKQHPVFFSIPVVMAGSLGILKLAKVARIYGDAAIGIVSSVGIAGGILITSIAGGFNVDLLSFLFGNILAVSQPEVYATIVLSMTIIGITLLFYYENFSIAFDEEYAKVSGISTDRISSLIVLLTAVTVVLAMKVVGVMLTSALLILPAVTALQMAKSFRSTMFLSAMSGLLSVITGICSSFLLNLPTGATIVMINFLFFLAAFVCKKVFLKKKQTSQ
jgi:zinc transport system permease protein